MLQDINLRMGLWKKWLSADFRMSLAHFLFLLISHLATWAFKGASTLVIWSGNGSTHLLSFPENPDDVVVRQLQFRSSQVLQHYPVTQGRPWTGC